MVQRLEMVALPNFLLVEPGYNLLKQITQSLNDVDLTLQDGDVWSLLKKLYSRWKIATPISIG